LPGLSCSMETMIISKFYCDFSITIRCLFFWRHQVCEHFRLCMLLLIFHNLVLCRSQSMLSLGFHFWHMKKTGMNRMYEFLFSKMLIGSNFTKFDKSDSHFLFYRSQKGVSDRWEKHCRMLFQIGLGSWTTEKLVCWLILYPNLMVKKTEFVRSQIQLPLCKVFFWRGCNNVYKYL